MMLRRGWRKLLKRWARNAFFPGWRLALLRAAGHRIGRDTYIADDFMIVEELAGPGLVTIGSRVSIAPHVTLVTSSHPNASRIRPFAPVAAGPVTIEDDAWIGAGAVILPGVRIGQGAIVGANTVVARSVPPLTVVAGPSAEVMRTLDAPADWA